MTNNYFDKLKGISITDVVQLGVLEIEEGISELTPFHVCVYLEFEDVILKLESVSQYSKLSFQYVDKYQIAFEIEEDMMPVKSSIAEIVLSDTMADNRIDSIDIYGSGTDLNEKPICDALSIHLICGQELFFDPTYVFGINIGGERQKQLWLGNYPNTPSITMQKESIQLT